MKRHLSHIALLIGMLISFAGSGFAQQIPISNQYVYEPARWNPAAMGTHEFNRVFLGHQQRKVAFKGLGSSQFLTFNGAEVGNRKLLGWGIFIVNDWEFVNQRIQLDFAFSAHILNKEEYYTVVLDSAKKLTKDYLDRRYRLSVGAMGGLISWNQNLNDAAIFDRSELILNQQGISKPDLGVGIDFLYEVPLFKIEAGAAGYQLPEWMFRQESQDTLVTIPHMLARAGGLLHISEEFSVGPYFLYRAVIGDDYSLRQAWLDAQVKAEWKDRFWVGAGYRINNAAVNASAGWTISDRDSTRNERYFPQRWDVSGNFEYPLNGSITFGPVFELGLTYTFGSLKRIEYDTVEVYRGPFWATTGNVNDFMKKRTNGNPLPEQIFAKSDNRKSIVTLTYEFSDNTFQYDPENIVGLIELLAHMSEDVQVDAFHPTDSRDITEYPDKLTKLLSVQFSCQLRDDNIGAKGLADSTLYKGEEMTETVVYDEKDSTFVVGRGLVNNVELSYLKLAKMRDYFLDLMEDKMVEDVDPFQEVEWKPLKITSNNPKLEAYQKNQIIFRFEKKERRRRKRPGE